MKTHKSGGSIKTNLINCVTSGVKKPSLVQFSRRVHQLPICNLLLLIKNSASGRLVIIYMNKYVIKKHAPPVSIRTLTKTYLKLYEFNELVTFTLGLVKRHIMERSNMISHASFLGDPKPPPPPRHDTIFKCTLTDLSLSVTLGKLSRPTSHISPSLSRRGAELIFV